MLQTGTPRVQKGVIVPVSPDQGGKNVAARGNYYGNTGVLMSNSATSNNDCAINIAASNEANSILGDGANIGVVAHQNTTFNNRSTLYIGRLAQCAPTDTTSDIFDYIEVFYNWARRHCHLGGVSP